MAQLLASSLDGLCAVSFESRRSSEMHNLLQKRGARVRMAASMREVPLEDQHEAIAFGKALKASDCEVLLLLTGVGTRMLVDAMALSWPKEEVIAWLSRLALVCRGPKPASALKELGLKPSLRVPEPNTWRELLVALDEHLPVAGRSVAVQEYGRSNPELIKGLTERGARVRTVPVYAWALPEDVTALNQAVAAIVQAQVDVVLFTSATQMDHLMQCAQQESVQSELLAKLRDFTAVASIGPVTTECLQSHSVRVDIEPKHPKMGHLVAAVAQDTKAVLSRKRAM